MTNIQLELTLNEARVLCEAIQGHNPPQADEMIAIMLYNRIKRKLEEKYKLP